MKKFLKILFYPFLALITAIYWILQNWFKHDDEDDEIKDWRRMRL